jgi:hypothetical protein
VSGSAPYPLSPYPKEIGFYVNDMPKMGRWEEREKLLKDVQKNNSDPLALRRLKLWDYFFRIDPKNVGTPQRDLIERLKKNLVELHKLETDLTKQKQQIESEVYQSLVNARTRSRNFGKILLLLGILAAFWYLAESDGCILPISVFLLLLGCLLYFPNRGNPTKHLLQIETEKQISIKQAKYEKEARDIVERTNTTFAVKLNHTPSGVEVKRNEIEQAVKKEQEQARNQRIGGIFVGVLLSVTGFGAIVGVPVIIISFLATNKKLTKDYIGTEIDKRLALTYESIDKQNKPNVLDGKRSLNIQDCIQLTLEQIQGLNGEIEFLISQIPIGASDHEVDEWFTEELNKMELLAIKETGMEDRLANIGHTKKRLNFNENTDINVNTSDVNTASLSLTTNKQKVFRIHGPANFQTDIPREYKQDMDNKRHLVAKQLAQIGTFIADFYGVYYIEYLLIGVDVLAVYSTFYDFILNRRFSPKTRVLHYLDIVTVQTAQDYLVRELPNDQKLELDGVPSLTLSLTSGEHIEIHYPAFEHLQKLTDEEEESGILSFNEDRWKFNMEKYARNANKHIQEQMHLTKNQLRGL